MAIAASSGIFGRLGRTFFGTTRRAIITTVFGGLFTIGALNRVTTAPILTANIDCRPNVEYQCVFDAQLRNGIFRKLPEITVPSEANIFLTDLRFVSRDHVRGVVRFSDDSNPGHWVLPVRYDGIMASAFIDLGTADQGGK